MSSPKVDCSQWMELNDFSSYIRLLASKTQFKKDDLEVCQNEICTAVYGTGNPDISGVGVRLVIVLKQSGKTNQWHRIAKTGLAAFVDPAAYFALSLQLATIAVVVRKDYGISTADLGAIEARISQSVAVITVVKFNNSPVILPFLSRCIHAFDVSPIGNGEGSEVSSTLAAYLFSFWLLAGLPKTHPHLNEKAQEGQESGIEPSWRDLVNVWFSDRPVVAVVPLFVVVGLSVLLLSVIFTLRKVQGKMSENTGQEYAGNEWGFGQIISIILFIPVAVDMGYQWRFGLAYEQ